MKSIADHYWLAIPLSVWLFTSLIQVVVRGEAVQFFTKDFPRMGSEFCKIALTIMLGAIAVDLRSPAFSQSLLATSDSLILVLLSLLILVCFFISFKCFQGIEGVRPRWNPRVGEITWRYWMLRFVLAQAFGVGPLAFVIYSLKGRT